MSRDWRRRSRYCISETSPPKPMMVFGGNVLIRLTSVNRASEPYDARLSAAITTPPLYLTPSTDVPVTAGDCVCCFGMAACMYEWSYGP